MNKEECIIIYPVDGYVENALKAAIGLKINKIILMDENESYVNSFSRFGLITHVRPILKDDVRSVVSSVADIISDAKNKHDCVSVLLLPSDPVIGTGVYVASCMEKVKVFAPSDIEIKCLTLPIFPFVSLNEKERFVSAKIIENKEMSRKNLLTVVKREGYCDKLYSGRSDSPTAKETAVMRQLQRILNKLEEMGLVTKEKRSKRFVWKPTVFGKLIFR